jgi:hypothetical protein
MQQSTRTISSIILLLTMTISGHAETVFPKYKPSARSPEAMDIRTSAYGASINAPKALTIGDTAPDFVVPKALGGSASLAAKRAQGPVVIIFYRGHW